ncbi:putative cell division control protein Cdc6 [Pyronema domesticum]|uniref:Cell division control protein n=1 Tax=Pyronema omphalodes (strain CBS 100304) TaxID=1076935 RepID=U4KVS8_PYROM|nr:putative cell division control protein Cdc6 [Pyronema domesticum]CCX05081.1 Similar to Cell division control protein 18; acc. no. P41411 [Pyronema omphalodes CBS 100304]
MAAAVGKRVQNFSVEIISPTTTRTKRRFSTIQEEEVIGDTIVVRQDPVQEDEPRTPKRARVTRATRTTRSTPLSARQPLSPTTSTARNILSPTTPSTKIAARLRTTRISVDTENIENVKENIKENINEPVAAEVVKVVKKIAASPPKTPRHRDAIKKPSTPRHRVCVVSKPMTPRSKLLATPTHASTPSTVLTTAKSLFARSTQGGKLIGRETERTKLNEFITDRLEEQAGGCLYISGPPGCGKSALLTEIMGTVTGTVTTVISKAWVNCMALQTPSAIYTTLLDSLSASGDTLSDLEALFITSKTSRLYLLVLDEIDHLLTGDILPTLFELSLRKNSRLILLGIANALDLTDRFLPRLKSKGLTPSLLPFLPYTAPQIAEVLTTRLKSLLSPTEAEESPNHLPFVHPAAIQLLSKKVAAATGDLRKAFDILRRALELVEMESLNALRAQAASSERPVLGETVGNVLATPSRALVRPNWTALTAPRASLPHVAKASAAALGNSVSTRIGKLNAHQKALLCVLVAKSDTAPMNLVRLREAYQKACRGEAVKLMPLVGAEFRGVLEAMEAGGVVDVRKDKPKGKAAVKGTEEVVVSRVGRMELLTAISGADVKGRDGLVAILGA